MAKKSAAQDYEIDWIQRDRKVIDGLDHLGIELVSVNLYQAMLPGLTNVTERARYYAFYPWTVHRYAQEGPKSRTKAAWRNWFRALDFTYAVACMAHERELGQDLGSSVVGAELATNLIKNEPAGAKIDLHGPSAVGEIGTVPETGSYFKNPEGGFGQYYKGPLRELGVLQEHGSATWPDVLLSSYAGKRIAQTLDGKEPFDELKAIAIKGSARLGDLAGIGKAIHPGAIDADSEEASLLRKMFFGDDRDLCQGQQSEHIQWRRSSLLLMLNYLREAGAIKRVDLAYEFRWGCASGHLPDGRLWAISPALSDVKRAWAAYQRNDLLNYSLECIFYAALQEVDREPRRPGDLVTILADFSMAKLRADGERPGLPALPKTVGEFVASMRMEEDHASDAWGPLSTWALADRLQAAARANDVPTVMALAVRVLGRLATDRGDCAPQPFAPIPNAVEMASNHEVHLRRWWDRTESRASERTSDFLKELILEWVLFRHLRVATRKLANQGVSTYKFSPEEGRLLLVAERLPKPTYTAPRIRQGFRILEDLHLISRNNGEAVLSELGATFLGGTRA